MTPVQFKLTATSIVGTVIGWKVKIANRLNVNERTVRKWLEAREIPDWVEEKFAELVDKNNFSPWPRDEWLLGTAFNEQGRPREYIAHLQHPRFIARIVAVYNGDVPEDYEQPVDLTSGPLYGVDQETTLCEINFIDPADTPTTRQWLEAAADEIERISNIEEKPAQGRR